MLLRLLPLEPAPARLPPRHLTRSRCKHLYFAIGPCCTVASCSVKVMLDTSCVLRSLLLVALLCGGIGAAHFQLVLLTAQMLVDAVRAHSSQTLGRRTRGRLISSVQKCRRKRRQGILARLCPCHRRHAAASQMAIAPYAATNKLLTIRRLWERKDCRGPVILLTA